MKQIVYEALLTHRSEDAQLVGQNEADSHRNVGLEASHHH